MVETPTLDFETPTLDFETPTLEFSKRRHTSTYTHESTRHHHKNLQDTQSMTSSSLPKWNIKLAAAPPEMIMGRCTQFDFNSFLFASTHHQHKSYSTNLELINYHGILRYSSPDDEWLEVMKYCKDIDFHFACISQLVFMKASQTLYITSCVCGKPEKTKLF